MKLALRPYPCLAVAFLALAACPSAQSAAMSETEVDEAVARGYAAIKANDVPAAKAAFLSVVENAPDSPKAPEAMLRVGHLQLRADAAQALATLAALAERYPHAAETVTALHRVGSLHMRLKRYDDAQKAFRQAADHSKSSQMNRGKALLQVGFLDIMKFWAGEYWARDSEGSLVRVKSDTPEAKTQHLEDARKRFEAVRAEYAGKPGEEKQIAAIADAAVGEIYLTGKMPRLAEEAYWRVLQEYGAMPAPLNSLARYGIAQAKFRAGDLAAAAEQFDLLLSEFVPGGVCGITVATRSMRANAAVWKVLALSEMGQLDEALAAARQAKQEIAADADPSLSKPAANLGLWEASLLSRTGSAEEAIQALQRVIDNYSGTPYAYRAKLVLKQLTGGEQ